MNTHSEKKPGCIRQIMWKSGPSAVPLGLLLLVTIIIFIWWILSTEPADQMAQKSQLQNEILSLNYPMLTQPSKITTRTLAMYYIEPSSDKTDIFRVIYTRTMTGTEVISTTGGMNQTNSPTITELWPVLSPDGRALAYFGFNDGGERNLWVQPTDNNVPPKNLTQKIVDNRLHHGFEIKLDEPPKWSPDSQRLLFLVEQTDGKGTAVELYTVQVDTGQIFPLKTDGVQVLWAEWQDNMELLYLAHEKEGGFGLYATSLLTTGSKLISKINPVDPQN